MILSIVIVNYNVKFFLEQCLCSLKKAIESCELIRTETEVFIVDNSSTDRPVELLGGLYPLFHFIRNKDNTGFARANNQALSLCSGEFILFLNPDTILAEDSLGICISFFRSSAGAGAIGTKMIDGSGRFLKESKRGFPSPAASFFKMTGFAALFPQSKWFAAYYMGHLDKTKPHPVDILSGAFMMVRKKVLDLTGGFDEQFFMYAEDIDLSYRILQAGYQNYYLPQTTIIHFKGESTRKDIYYVKIFYHAMELFIKKHFRGKRSDYQLMFVRAGVRFHQALTALRLPFKRAGKDRSSQSPVFLKGDSASIRELKDALTRDKIPLAEYEKTAREIIYCEGPGLSWKSIIEETTKGSKTTRHTFHGLGTHAAVGSHSSSRQGGVFEI